MGVPMSSFSPGSGSHMLISKRGCLCLLLKNEAWGVTHTGLLGSPLDPLERTAGHVDDAPSWAGHHSDQPLPDALEEARRALLLGTFRDQE